MMHFDKNNLITKTMSRGYYDHWVEMTHIPSGITVRMEGLQAETSLPTLTSRARELLGRKVKAHLEAQLLKEDQSQ